MVADTKLTAACREVNDISSETVRCQGTYPGKIRDEVQFRLGKDASELDESISRLRRMKMETIQIRRFCWTIDPPACDAGRRHGSGNTEDITAARSASACSGPSPSKSDVTRNDGRSRSGEFRSATSAPANSTLASSATYAGPMDATRYIIGPEDSLQVTVWKEPTLSGNFPVRPDGMISLVLVGDLPAAGLTPMALSNDITQRLKKYIQDPVVTVAVLGVNSQRIFLVGEVGKVGPVMLTPGMTPLQAIVTAGGLSQFANSKHIYILRTVAGKQQKIAVQL